MNGFKIIAPSRPGYLGTPLSTGRTFAEQGDALAALLDVLGIGRIAVFAASGGGPSAYELASRHPERVSRLVQVDGVCMIRWNGRTVKLLDGRMDGPEWPY